MDVLCGLLLGEAEEKDKCAGAEGPGMGRITPK